LLGATCGLTGGGELYCWGGFDGADIGTPRPRRVFASLEVASFALAQVMASREDYLCVVARDGAACCWAGTSPSRGETGDGGPARYRGTEPAPTRVAGADRIESEDQDDASARFLCLTLFLCTIILFQDRL
jgi:hypothetical protein